MSAPGKELEALGLMGLGQQGRKSASGVGEKKKNSHFTSEALSFLCNSLSYSPCPHSGDFQQEISFPAWEISIQAPQGSVPPRINTVLWVTGSSGDSGPPILEQELPDPGNSPVPPHSTQWVGEDTAWASPLLVLHPCPQPLWKAASTSFQPKPKPKPFQGKPQLPQEGSEE